MNVQETKEQLIAELIRLAFAEDCLLYTSDAADD